MNTYNNFNELAAGQGQPLHSDMSVFNVDEDDRKQFNETMQRFNESVPETEKIAKERKDRLRLLSDIESNLEAIGKKYSRPATEEDERFGHELHLAVLEVRKMADALRVIGFSK